MLFRGLVAMEGVEAVGLIQSSNLVVDPGLPVDRHGTPLAIADDAKVDRLSQVVVSLQQGPASHRFEWLRKKSLKWLVPLGVAAMAPLGRKVRLGVFEPARFQDFIWRSMFAKSLPDADFASVTGAAFRVLRWPWSSLHAIGVASSWLGRGIYPRLDTRGIDIVIAETPFPSRVRAPSRLVVRYHDAIPLLMPHTIKDHGYHRTAHYQALRRNALDGAWFACVSDATRNDLLSVLPQVGERAVTIPNMISHHFFAEDRPASRVPQVVWSRKNRRAAYEGGLATDASDLQDGTLSYLLIVGSIEPRKNHLTLLDAFERLRGEGFERLHLVVVGSAGWNHEAIIERFSPWLRRGGLHLLADVPSDDLRLLYRHAAATVCPSYGEGFDFPGVEAMRSGGVVAASDLPVHRDVFGDACEFFNAYSSSDLARALRLLLDAESPDRREALVAKGAEIARRYLPETVLPSWQSFLQSVAREPVANAGTRPSAHPYAG